MLKRNIKCSKVILNLEISCFKILNKSHMQKFDIWTLKQPCDFTTIPVQYSCSLDFKLVILNYPCLVQLLLRIQTSVVFEMNDSMVLAFVFFLVLCLLYIIEQIHQLRLETRQPRRIVRAFWLKRTSGVCTMLTVVALKLFAKIVKNIESSVWNLWSVMRKSMKCNGHE